MNKAELLKSVEAPVNENIPELSPGDTVSVHIKITEGDRERIQIFKGTILLVRGGGIGVAAMRVGYLWIPGGTLTFTINPADAKNAYPETKRDNNVATFTLP